MNVRLSALTTILGISLSLAFIAQADEPVKPPAKEKFHLYLLVGQSNMAGRGKIEEQDRKPHDRVLMLDKADQWRPAVEPMHFDKPSAGVGLGRTFGLLMAEANPEITIGLIPCAVGGSPIDAWRPGEYYAPTKSRPWDDAVRRTKLALESGELKGILWHQGESDATAALAPKYAEKLHALIGAMRKEFNAPEVPFIAGQIGRFEGKPWSEHQTQIDQVHRDLPKHVPFTAYVSSENLKHNGDKIHFDADSYREFGKRYFAVFSELKKATAAKEQ